MGRSIAEKDGGKRQKDEYRKTQLKSTAIEWFVWIPKLIETS